MTAAEERPERPMLAPEGRELRVMRCPGGHLAASAYSDRFWTPLLGPTATLLWRRLAERDSGPVDLAAVARELGILKPVVWRKAVTRLVRFGIADLTATELWLRDAVPSLTTKGIERLPGGLQAEHRALYGQAPAR